MAMNVCFALGMLASTLKAATVELAVVLPDIVVDRYLWHQLT